MIKKETILEIGGSIKEHHEKEIENRIGNCAIARAYCHLTNARCNYDQDEIFWLTNKSWGTSTPLIDKHHIGRTIYKNTPLGGEIILHSQGPISYDVKKNFRVINTISGTVFNRAIYDVNYSGIEGITVNDETNVRLQYKDIRQLLHDREFMKAQLEKERAKAEEEKRLELERKAAAEKAKREREEAERKEREAEAARIKAEQEAAAEAARIEAERIAEEARKAAEEARRKEEEQRRLEEEALNRKKKIEELEEGIKQADQIVELIHNIVRKDVSLRSQHILDPSQETAKRSHIFDGVPVVIEGGPGTGKTTTMIQRLKFLISKEVLLGDESYENPLTEAQVNALTDPKQINYNWLFFSPTHQLLSFLRNNMVEEDLRASEANTTVLADLDGRLMLDYKLHDPEKKGPFKLPRHSSELQQIMIREPKKVIASFESYCIKEISKKILSAYQLSTSDYSWHKDAMYIKAICKRAENIKDMDALLRLVTSLEDNCKKICANIESQLNEETKKVSVDIQMKVEDDKEMVEQLTNLFLSWKEERIPADEEDEEEFYDEDEEETISSVSIEFKPELFKNLKPFVKKLALTKFDNKAKLSKRQKELGAIIMPYLEGVYLDKIGELNWFVKNYSSICKGLANTVLNQFTRLYKAYRKQQLEIGSMSYNKILLEKYIKKDNKVLHPDELHLIVGFINRQLYSIYKKSRVRFDSMSKNKYMEAYKEHVKYVIGVDEATDYSWLDYYLITSLRHYEFSSITLCGDSMQGLNDEGITNWKDLDDKHLLSNLEIDELTRSYRQTAVLVNMAREMFMDEKGVEAPYQTSKEEYSEDAKPLAFISREEDDKVQWMAERIVEVFKKYGDTMPSVAIFVGDNENVDDLIENLNDTDELNSIKVVDCTEGRTSTLTKCVRIFRMREVKGMEFEVAFFHNIDDALAGANTELMRRYLYVGISRASSHLAATFCQEEGNEGILKYFDRDAKNWRI